MQVRQVLINDQTAAGVVQETGAEFWISGGKLRWRYAVPGVGRLFESEGITVGQRRLFPDDGRAFYDALPLALSVSSAMSTRDVERGDMPES